PDEPAGILQLTLLHDQGVEGEDLGELESLIPLHDDPLPLGQRNPLGIAENHPAILVIVDPDAHVMASGIECIANGTTTTTGHRSLQTPKITSLREFSEPPWVGLAEARRSPAGAA